MNECAKVNRIGGSLATAGSGLDLFTTNLDFLRTEGIDFVASTSVDMGGIGQLEVSGFASYLLTQESQSSSTSPVIDCLGKFGTDCAPTPELRFTQRTSFTRGPASVSLLWRYIGEVEIQDTQKVSTFDGFENIDAVNYFDLTGSYDLNDTLSFRLGIRNLLEEDQPIVGNEAGSTSFNSGNTFPSTYDVFGRVYTFGINAKF